MFYNLFRQLPIDEHLGCLRQKGSFVKSSHWARSSSSFTAGFPEHNNDLTSENIVKPNIEERVGALYKIKMLLFRLQAQIWKGPASV